MEMIAHFFFAASKCYPKKSAIAAGMIYKSQESRIQRCAHDIIRLRIDIHFVQKPVAYIMHSQLKVNQISWPSNATSKTLLFGSLLPALPLRDGMAGKLCSEKLSDMNVIPIKFELHTNLSLKFQHTVLPSHFLRSERWSVDKKGFAE